ncbi:hypothetical protein [Dyella jejuensis]
MAPALEPRAARPGDAAYRQKLEDAAVKFEGMFIAHLLGEMRKATEQLSPDQAGAGSKPGAGLLDHAYRLVADDIAAQRAFGIADSIVAQMLPKDAATTPMQNATPAITHANGSLP